MCVRHSSVSVRATSGHGFLTTLRRGVVAGWLLALMVWLMPFAESGRIWVIIIVTYLVGLAEFSHIVPDRSLHSHGPGPSTDGGVTSWPGSVCQH